jgi:3alpha(or 20beta)-hydroxysteroid dehydrogenase
MGAATARLFASEGAKVVVADVLETEGQAVADSIKSNRGEARFQRLDVASETDWDATVAATLAAYGKIDILVNNAGMTRAEKIQDTDAAFMRRMLEVNIMGSYLGMRATMEPMRDNGGGVVINIASGLAFTSLPGFFAYGVSKWAVRGMTRLGAKDLAEYNIRVVTVTPGAIDTPALLPSVRENAKSMIPLGRAGGVDEFARVVVFIASDAASYVSGAELMVDGAMLC